MASLEGQEIKERCGICRNPIADGESLYVSSSSPGHDGQH